MASPHQIIPMMEGMVSTMSTIGSQVAGDWVRMMKQVMHRVSIRDETDWEFMALSDIDEDGAAETNAAPLISCTMLYGALIGTNSADAELDWVQFADADTDTFAGGSALDNDVLAILELPAAATDGTEELHAAIWPGGLICATGLTVSADGQDGTNPAADDIRGWVVFRT